VERDLMLLERIDTSINLADHFTKSLLPALFKTDKSKTSH
jgi:hypothetical protein